MVSIPWLVGATWRYIRDHGNVGRNVVVRDDDTFLSSYPRSGNTWTRFLIVNLMHPDGRITFKNIEQIVPDVYSNSYKAMAKLASPRLIKTHEPFDSRFKRVIYIVRDPRDVAVSLYHWEVKRRHLEEGYPIEKFVPRFVAGEFQGTAGSWGENVASWLATRLSHPGFLVLRYEDIHENPTRELRKIAEFLGIQYTAERLQRAVELSTPERMRELERDGSREWKTTRSTRQDKPFVRSARVGDWRSSLQPHCAATIEEAWWPIMKTLGYEPTASSFASPPMVSEGLWSSLTGGKTA